MDAHHARKEADYAIDGAKLDPYNESPWRYLVGILRQEPSLVKEYQGKATELRQVLVDAGRDPDGCSNLTSARIDMLEMMSDSESLELVRFLSMLVLDRVAFVSLAKHVQAIEMCKGLAGKHDVIRKKYWLLRVSELETALAS